MADLIVSPRKMAWGLAILVDMYHDLHEIVYREGHTWACGIILAQICAWQHIVVVQHRCNLGSTKLNICIDI